MQIKKPTVTKNEKKVQVDNLIAMSAKLKNQYYPPGEADNLVLLSPDLPIWANSADVVRSYQEHFKAALDIAYRLYPECSLSSSKVTIPSHIGLPHFFFNVQKVVVYKNKAKESKTFGAVGAVLACCGDFEYRDRVRMEDYFHRNPEGELVCHREFIDLRARIYLYDKLKRDIDNKYISTHFYTNGLIIAPNDVNDFQFVNNTKNGKPRQPRSDSYTNPIAQNADWKVFIKRRKI